jgi:hypothetical protein
MKMVMKSYNKADRLLASISAGKNRSAYDMIISAIEGANPSIGYWLPKSWVEVITEAFAGSGFGWKHSVPSRFQDFSSKRGNTKAIDLRQPEWRVDIEIERGNVASTYRCLLKMLAHRNLGDMDVGVIITGVQEIARACGENIGYFERTTQEFDVCQKAKVLSGLPLLIIGLQPVHSVTGESLLYQPSLRLLQQVKNLRTVFRTLNSGEREERRKQLQTQFLADLERDPPVLE